MPSALESTTATVRRETEEILSNRSSFSTRILGLQLAWDSVSLGALKTCPRFYHYSIVRGYSSSHMNDHLTFGIHFHKATEIYEKAKAAGATHDESLISAIKYAVTITFDIETGRPWTSQEPTKSRNTLLRTIVWYLDHFQDDSLKTLTFPNGLPAIELSFRIPLGDIGFTSPSNEEFILCGHIDKIAEFNNEIYIEDKKTTKSDLDDRYFEQFTPDNQMSLYAVAGTSILTREISGILIDGCQILVNGGRFRRKPIPRSQEMLEEWLTDLKFWLRQAIDFASNNYWPMNEKSCGYGRRQCQFRPVCSAEPQARQEMLDSFYSRRVWDPLETR